MSQKNIITNNEFTYNSNQSIAQSKHSIFKYCYNLSNISNFQIFLCLLDTNNNLSILSTKENADHFISNYLTFPIQAKEIFNPSNMNDFLSNEDDFKSITNEKVNSDYNYLTTQTYTRSNFTQSERNKKKKYTIKLMFPEKIKNNSRISENEYDFLHSQDKQNVLLFKKRNNKPSNQRVLLSNENQHVDVFNRKNGDTCDFQESSNKNNVHNLKLKYTSQYSILNEDNNDINIEENNETNNVNSKTDFDNIFNFDNDNDKESDLSFLNLPRDNYITNEKDNNNNKNENFSQEQKSEDMEYISFFGT